MDNIYEIFFRVRFFISCIFQYSLLSMIFLLAYVCDFFCVTEILSFLLSLSDDSEDDETVFIKLSVFYIRLEKERAHFGFVSSLCTKKKKINKYYYLIFIICVI